MEGPRGIRPDELPAVVALADDVFAPERRDMGPAFPTLFRVENADWLCTMWDGGRPVSLVGVWRGEVETFGRRLPVAHVGAVCTRPEYRGRGLAGRVLQEALLRLQRHGTAVVFISGGRRLYTRLGARPFGELRLLEVEGSAARRLGPADCACHQPAVATDGILGELAALHAAEPVRHVRDAADWRALLPAKGYVPPRDGGVGVVRRGGRAVAYVLWNASLRGPSPAEPPPLSVEEYAGDRQAVWAGVAFALDATGRTRARLHAQVWDAPVLDAARRAGAAPVPRCHQGTARVLDADALLRALEATRGPGPDPGALAALRPTAPLGTPEEAKQAAALTQVALGPGEDALPLPHTWGPNFI